MTDKTKYVVESRSNYEIDLLELKSVDCTGPSGPQFVCVEFNSGKERTWRCRSHESARRLYVAISDAWAGVL